MMLRFLGFSALVLLTSFGQRAAASGEAPPPPVRLSDVRKIYIDKMANGLDDYLKSAISKKFHDRLEIVLDRSRADAIMSEANPGARRTQSATVTLTDPSRQTVLWSGTAGDRSLTALGKHEGEKELADHLIGQLKKAMER